MSDARTQALDLWRSAFERHRQGDLRAAIQLYKRSIEICPTAEAHTFLGWAFAHAGRIERAIAECKRAIEVDPDFGNPYNDIGAYLIELGREEEAVRWLERAKTARRYEPRHYPYFNLARVYVRQHKIYEAIRELRGALRVEPRYEIARKELIRLELLVRVLN